MKSKVMWQPQRNMMWPQGQEPPPQPQAPSVHHRVPGPSYLGYPQIPAGHGPPLLPDPSWTSNDYLLEQHFSQMSFTQPPPPIFHHQQQQQQPLQYHARPMQNNALQGPRIASSGIPSLLDIRVPRPVHLHNGYHPRNQQRNRNNFPSINTSVPPPRITLLQKPRPQVQQPAQLSPRIPSASSPPISTFVVDTKAEEPQHQNHNGVEKEGEEEEEEEVVAEKPEPELKIKTILKRPASTPSNLALSGSNNNSEVEENPVENLKKREEEYAKVRLRILGSTGIEENIS